MSVVFHMRAGQLRPNYHGKMPGEKPIMKYQPMRPKRAIILCDVGDGHGIRYETNKLGNVEVTAPKHIYQMMRFGWPIYIGDGKQRVAMEDLLWPSVEPDSEYQKIISAAIANEASLLKARDVKMSPTAGRATFVDVQEVQALLAKVTPGTKRGV